MGCLLEAIAAVCVAKVVDHLVVDDILAVGIGHIAVHATFRRRRSARDHPIRREDVRGALCAQSLAVALVPAEQQKEGDVSVLLEQLQEDLILQSRRAQSGTGVRAQAWLVRLAMADHYSPIPALDCAHKQNG